MAKTIAKDSFFEAVASGKSDDVKIWIEKGANVNSKYDYIGGYGWGWRPLHVAARAGYDDIVELLLESGAQIDVRDSGRSTPLMVCKSESTKALLLKYFLLQAAASSTTEEVTKLIDEGTSIDSTNSKKQTLLHIAAMNGQFDITQFLLSRGLKPNSVDIDGQTPLHLAVTRGNYSVVQILLNKVPVDLCDKNGETALHKAMHSDHKLIIQLLLDANYSKDIQNINGDTPLMLARKLKKTNAFKMLQKSLLQSATDGTCEECIELLNYGASVKNTNENQQTALHVATKRGSFDIVKALLAFNINLNSVDKDGQTALHLAVRIDHKEIIQLLIEAGCSLDIKNKEGKTPLESAQQHSNVHVLNAIKQVMLGAIYQCDKKQLIRCLGQVHVDTTLMGKQTALHVAARNNDTSTVSLLLSYKANIYCLDEYGQSPLHIAATNGNTYIVQQFITKPCNLNLRDNNGATPLYAACANGHEALVPYLITPRNANIGAKDTNDSPLCIATEKGFARVVQALVESEYVNLSDVYKSGDTILHSAVMTGNRAIVSILLASGVAIDTKNEEHETALFLAIRSGYIKIANLLMQYGANINTKNINSDTPLHIAASNNDAVMVKTLLANRADPTVINNNGITALKSARSKGFFDFVRLLQQNSKEKELIAAVQVGDVLKARQLITDGVDSNLVDMNNDLEPLLHTCIQQQGNEEILSLLLESPSIDLNCLDKDGCTPLEKALVHAFKSFSQDVSTKDNQSQALNIKDLFMVIKLLSAKRGIVSRYHSIMESLCAQVNSYESTVALFKGVATNNVSGIQHILENGADPNIFNEMGLSLVHIAADNGFIEMLEILHTYNAALDVENEKGQHPLHLACASGHLKAVQWLLAIGANGNQTDKDGNTPLHVSAACGFEEIVALLLANPNTFHNPLNADGMNPMQLAAQAGKHQIVDLLLQTGVDVNHHNKDGLTALHLAARQGFSLVVESLLVMNAQVNGRSWNGDTPLHCAAMSGNDRLVRILLDFGADVDQPNQHGLIPEMLCANSTLRQIFVDYRKDKEHKSNIIAGIHEGNLVRVKTLLAEGADCNSVDENGNSLLHLCVEKKQIEMVELLLNQPAIRVVVCNKDKKTPLLLAIQLGHRDIARLLYDAVPVNIVDTEDVGIVFDGQCPLGRGTYGTVYKGTVKDQIVAVKKSNRDNVNDLLLEIDAMKKCKSPYIVQVVAIDENESNPALALEFMDCGNLREYLDAKRNGIKTKLNVTALQVAWVLANALADLHRNNMMHRDLKSLNVLLSTEHYIKLGDFGTSREVGINMTTATGTPLWTAPEVFKSQSHYSFPADIYSFGVILTELDTLQLPYANLNRDALTISYLVREGKLRPKVSSTCVLWLRELSEQCLAFEPSQRPAADQIVAILQKELYKPQQPTEVEMGKEISSMTDSNTPTITSTSSTITSSMLMSTNQVVNTKMTCKVCRMNNPIDCESCEKCSSSLPTAAEKLEILQKRAKVAKKKNIEIEATVECDICGIKNPIDAVSCTDEDCLAELAPLTDEEKLARMVESFERVLNL